MHRIYALLKKKQRPLIGVDISATRAKLLELDGRAGAYRVLAYASEALPADVVTDHQVVDAAAVAETLARALSRSGSATREAAIAVSGPAVISKVIDMPADLTDEAMEHQIAFDAQQYIPHPIEEVNLDFHVLERDPGNPEINKVLLVACRRDHIETRIAALAMARLQVQLVDVEEYALQNACALLSAHTPAMAAGGNVAVFDIGAHRTRLTVQCAGRSTYTREIAFGGFELARELIATHQLADMADLRARLRSGELDAQAIATEIGDFAQRAAGQIERALAFYMSAATHNETIDQVVAAGGATLYPGFESALRACLNPPVTVGNPLAGMLASRAARHNHVDREGPALMVAAGLALRSVQ
jgi:type IV pilus assembly protein PilM